MPVGIQLLIAFAVGGLLGFFFGWLKARGRAAVPDSRLENELRQGLLPLTHNNRLTGGSTAPGETYRAATGCAPRSVSDASEGSR